MNLAWRNNLITSLSIKKYSKSYLTQCSKSSANNLQRLTAKCIVSRNSSTDFIPDFITDSIKNCRQKYPILEPSLFTLQIRDIIFKYGTVYSVGFADANILCKYSFVIKIIKEITLIPFTNIFFVVRNVCRLNWKKWKSAKNTNCNKKLGGCIIMSQYIFLVSWNLKLVIGFLKYSILCN